MGTAMSEASPFAQGERFALVVTLPPLLIC